MITFQAPKTAQGGGFGFPPVKDTRPFARPGDRETPKAAPSKPAIPAYAPYPKARVAVEASEELIARRIRLCARHRGIFKSMIRAWRAQAQAWIKAQPGYDETRALIAAHETKIRNGFKKLHKR